MVDASWIFKAIRSNDATGRAQIGAVIDGINALIGSENYSLLDKVFQAIPTRTAGRHVLLSLVRATAPIRTRLLGWQPFVLEVKKEFDERGLESDRLLKGLI
ncbi:hypothetical protein CWR43_06965 [Rhizobium sullae]|uniref:Uncharacterized protein n=1 Tax=Rhizobium sullae TaxID=50338 RepID=A0A2N0DD61_RHISU|nr:hypothetical protein CWR43_06965 [Rhizobium sullae]